MPLHRHLRPRPLLLAALVLLGALGVSPGASAQQPVVVQQNTTVQQTNTASTTNTGPGSQTTVQQQHNSATVHTTGGSSTTTITQTNSQQQATSQTSVAQTTTTQQGGITIATARLTEAVALSAGCSNLVLSWPTGTPLAAVAAALSPSQALRAIFKLDAATGRYRGYSPSAPAFANDYMTIDAPLDAVFVCVNQAASLARPTR
jgi:hypothetical protein